MQLRVAETCFDPAVIFGCGQAFRFQENEGTWEGVAYGEKVTVRADGGDVVIGTSGPLPEKQWRAYFDLDRDYTLLFPHADAVLLEAQAFGRGLRILRQDPFETLISFIISANNHIGRIRGIVERLCVLAGEDKGSWFAFPQPDALCRVTEQQLRDIGIGYRAPYIAASARRAADGELEYLADMPWEDLRKELMRFEGVGPKVADCIALFGFGRTEAFPVDVWVRRIMKQLYHVDGGAASIAGYARRMFGAHAGIAQQYLFHYARHHLTRGS